MQYCLISLTLFNASSLDSLVFQLLIFCILMWRESMSKGPSSKKHFVPMSYPVKRLWSLHFKFLWWSMFMCLKCKCCVEWQSTFHWKFPQSKEIKICNFESWLNKDVSDSLKISLLFYPEVFCLLCFPSKGLILNLIVFFAE